MKLPKLRAEIRRIEAQLKRMRDHALNLEISATVPAPFLNDSASLTHSAKERAMLLFWRHLTREQRSEFTRERWFTAVGNRTGYKYRISMYNVFREEQSSLHHFCLSVTGEIMPLPDQMLAKKIIIEKDEPLFVATANRSSVTYTSAQFEEIVNRYN